MQPLRKTLLFIFLTVTAPAFAATPPERKPGLERVGHIIVCSWRTEASTISTGCFRAPMGSKTRDLRRSRSRPKVGNSRRCPRSSTTTRCRRRLLRACLGSIRALPLACRTDHSVPDRYVGL